jgi:hypothetical protein
MALTDAQIQALLANTRTKGVYTTYLGQFIQSGEGGVCVNEQWMDLRDKKASTLKQGFENAREGKNAPEGAEFVKVLTNEDKVYLINLKSAGIELPATDAGEAAPEEAAA